MSIKKYVTKLLNRVETALFPSFKSPAPDQAGPFIDTGSPGACLLGSCGCKPLAANSADRYVVINKGDAIGILDTVTGKVAPMVSRYVAGYLLPKAEELAFVDYATFEKHGLPSATGFGVIRNEHGVWGLLDRKTDRVAQFSTEEFANEAKRTILRKGISFDAYISRPHDQFLDIGAPQQNCSDF